MARNSGAAGGTGAAPDAVFAKPAVRTARDADGNLLIRHGLDLEPYDRQVGDWVRRGALRFPQRVALGEWDAGGQLQTLDYAQLKNRCDRVAQFLLDAGLSQERPIAILSEKSLSSAVLTLAGLQCGIPVCPISPAYALRAEARGRLLACIQKVSPGLVLVRASLRRCARRLSRLDFPTFERPSIAISGSGVRGKSSALAAVASSSAASTFIAASAARGPGA